MENLLNALRATAKPLMSITMTKIGSPTDDVWLMYEANNPRTVPFRQ